LHGKYISIFSDIFSRERVEPFSLERGLDSISFFFKLGITSFSVDIVRLRNDEGDPSGRPREAALRQRSSASASPRGPCRAPPLTGSRPACAGRGDPQRHRPLRRGTWLGCRYSTWIWFLSVSEGKGWKTDLSRVGL